jgi:transaldolase
MAIYIDSVEIEQIEKAMDLGWVSGVTTNPLLLSELKGTTDHFFKKVAKITSGKIFYQLVSETRQEMLHEAEMALNILGDHLVLKLAPTVAGFQFVSENGGQFDCCITAVFSRSQALVARVVNASYLAVYVDRAQRLRGVDVQFLDGFKDLLIDSKTRLLAASLKTVDQVIQSIKYGADDVTLPYSLIQELCRDPLSDQAILEFQMNGKGMVGSVESG